MALDPQCYRLTIITGQVTGRLLSEARAAGLTIAVEPALRTPIDPVCDIVALRRLAIQLRRGRFDVVHTHTAKAGTLGVRGPCGGPAYRPHLPRVPVPRVPPAARRAAYIAIERRLGRITDLALCVGTGVAVEAVRRGLVSPERIRTIGVAVEGFGQPGAEHAGLTAAPAAGKAAANNPAADGWTAADLPADNLAAREQARREFGIRQARRLSAPWAG